MALAASGPNAQQIQYWNDLAGPKWVALQDLINAQIAPLSSRAIDQADVRPGESVLDVGCGCGQTAVELARRVGLIGSVTAVDISTVMLEEARRRVAASGMGHVHFENADAQTHPFSPETFDLLFSRFGVMFFSDPTAAFANLQAALRPGGRMAFLCWRALLENPWMLVPLMAALQHIPPPPLPAPETPGPFAFADDDRVRRILSRAGFSEIRMERIDATLNIGGGCDLDQAVDFLSRMGPVSAALREADPDVLSRVAAAVREALAPFATPAGVRLGASAWLVTARRV
jgi:SAM-dependent methyltransferase